MNPFLKIVKENTLPFIVFMIMFVGCCAAWYIYHPASPYHARYSFVVSYQAIGTLSPGNRVTVRGIGKGQILDVKLTDDAVFVKVEVLADAKISRNSEFRLINAGLMGEREMCILTVADSDWIVDGDTVVGSYDDGIAGVGKLFLDAVEDLNDMKDMVVAFKDSLTVGSTGKSMQRVVKKGGALMNSSKALVFSVRDQAMGIVSRGDESLEKIRGTIEAAAKRGEVTVETGAKLLGHVDSLLSQVSAMKSGVDALVARQDASDNTVGLVLSEESRLLKGVDRLILDIDRLMADIKKRGLKMNVDIF